MKKSLLALCLAAVLLLPACGSQSGSTEIKNNLLFQDVADSIETVSVVAVIENEEIFTTSDPEEVQKLMAMFNNWTLDAYAVAAVDSEPTHVIYFDDQVTVSFYSNGALALVSAVFGTVYCNLPSAFQTYMNNLIKETAV